VKYIFSSLFLSLIFVSCQKPTENNLKIFKYNEYSNISSLDPAFSSSLRNMWPCNQLYNGLVKLDKNLKIKPDIAKEWYYDEGKNEYTFFLNDNVFYHKSEIFGIDSTRKVISNDFVYSFNRILDKKLASPGSWIFKNVKEFKAVNDTILKITLKNKSNSFLGKLTMKYSSVVPFESFNEGKLLNKIPIGTGPFIFKKWDKNIKLVLRRNNNYFKTDKSGKKLPYLDGVAISFIPDKKSEFMEFISNNLDMINSPENSIVELIFDNNGELKNDYSNINVIKNPYLNTEYLGFNTTNSLETEKYLRLAINHAIDRKKMMKYLRQNIGYPALSGIVPTGLNEDFFNERYFYDTDLAKKYLNKYLEKKKKKSIELNVVTDAQYLDVIEFIQSELKKLSINMKIEITPPSILRQGKAKGKYDFFRASWIADYPNPENYFDLFSSKNKTPNGPNYTYFVDEKFDSIYNILNEEESHIEKNFEILENIIYNFSPIIPLYYDMSIRLLNNNIVGMSNNAINMLNLEEVNKL
tara:strand:- start:107 stop:1678 length:1572 start_codon:yes stop_codon:yes gene_type:complete